MRIFWMVVCCLIWIIPETSIAQTQPSVCHAIAQNREPSLPIVKASFKRVAVRKNEVQISYVGHSAFRIESSQGVVIVTDYNGNHGKGDVPEIVTMNHAHGTHYTDYPDEAIKHVLRGWNPDGGAAKHHLVEQDVYVRNVPTDIYSDGILIEENGNSIFVFEIAGLCIGHLGHLHHPLTPQHIAEIGRLDIIFAPVDGTYTLSQDGMADVAKKLRASVLFPMHYFSGYSLNDFLEKMRESFEVTISEQTVVTYSLNTLPASPSVVVLPVNY